MKRVFALLLSLCMVLAMVPAAFAETGDVSVYYGDTWFYFDTVEEALANVEGGTITLQKDMTAGQIVIPQNYTLNLNGYTLTADMVVVFNGTVYGGKINVAEDMLKVIGNNGGKLPVWDPDSNMYYIVGGIVYQHQITVAEDGSFAKYVFLPNVDEVALGLLRNGGADNGISVKVLLSWNGGASQQIYTFSDEMVAQVYGSADETGYCAKAFQLTVTGISGIEDMTACAIVESVAGAKVSSEALDVAPEKVEQPSGEIAIESYGNSEWTAPQDGYVKFTINISGAMLAVLNGWTPVAEGADSVTAQVVAGTTYGIYPNNVAEASVVTWEYVDAPEGGDEEVDSIPSGSALAEGDNNVTLPYADVPMIAPSWTYTAKENGYLTVTVSSINGDSNLGMAFGMGRYTLKVGEATGEYTNTATVYMNAGETVNIAVLNTVGDAPAVINLSFAAGEPVVEKNPADYFDTDENGYYVIGSLESPVDIFVGNDDISYIYTAEADGTVTVTLTAGEELSGNCWIKVNNGDWDYFGRTVTVAEGDVVIINIWQGYEATVSLEAGAIAPTEPTTPAEPDGSQANPFVIDALPYTIEFFGGMDQYYTYTAVADGTIIVTALEGAILSLPNGEAWENDADGNYAIPVTAGYELVLNPWTMQPELSGSMVISYQEDTGATEPSEPEVTEPVSITETFAMSDYKVDGELGGGECSRELGDKVVFTISSGWFSTQARIYQNANGVFASTTGITSLTLNIGYKTSTFDVYVSEDGETWTEYQMGVAYTSAYSDVTIDFADAVKYIKLDANKAQIRLQSISITFAGGSSEPVEPSEPVETDPVETEPEETTTPEETTVPEVTEPTADSVLTIEEAIALGADFPSYTANKYYVTGVITNVYNTTYGNMYIEDESGNSLLIYGTYSADGSTRYDALEVKPVAGDTVTVYGIIGQYNGTSQMKDAWITAHTAAVPEETEATEPAGFQVVDAPVAGTAYKFGMIQKNVSETDVYYLNGNMNGYYMATTTDAGAAVDVYLEETEGGYYLYAMVNGAKQYINMVVSGTYVNGKYEDAASTVYTYDADSKTVIAVVNDADYWMGTRNDKTYTTVGPVKTSYNGFYMQFYAEVTTEPEVPETTEPVETEPVETEPVETEPVETEPVETEPVETEPVETEPVETEPVETEPVETEPVETEPVETEPSNPEPAETTVSKTVADLITEYGWTSSTTKQSFVLDDVVSVQINGGSNTGKAYNGDHIRIYATDSPAGTITISVAEGHELVSVKISTQTGTYAFLYVDGTTEDICNTTAAVSGTSVVLNSVKNGSDGKQVRVTAIEVTYK